MHGIWIPFICLVLLTVTALVHGCTCPSSPTNGYTSCIEEVPIGGKVHYHCYYDYRLEGDSTRTCRGVLGWSGNPPICSRSRRCTCPSSPTNGYTSCIEEVPIGGKVHYYCDYNYRLEGDSTRTCRGVLGWSGNPPICSRSRNDPTTADSFTETEFFDREGPTYLSLAADLGIAIGVGSLVLILITGTLSVVAGIAYWHRTRTSRITERRNSDVPLLDLNDLVSENDDVQATPSDVQDPPTSPPQKGGTETGPVDSSQLAGLNGDESSS